jgi:hypothetical protein
MTINSTDRIGGAMVNVIALSAADHGFANDLLSSLFDSPI